MKIKQLYDGSTLDVVGITGDWYIARNASGSELMISGRDAEVVQMPECEGKLPGHRHCKHGHTQQCPVPDQCDVL